MNPSLLEAALGYAELGYPVFPCAAGTKRPLTPNGFLDAVTDADQIERWWSERPNANIAIATQGLLVVDLDSADNTWLADEPDKQMDLSSGAVSLTASGGRHFIFRQPDGRNWRNTTGTLAPRVDTRADGGYIVVPPSKLEGGRAYCWAPDLELNVPPSQLPEPPPWLVRELDRIAGGSHSEPTVGDVSANRIPSGQRNSTLAKLAGSMRRVGMSQSEIFAAIKQANSDRCHPPLPDREVERIAASVSRYEPDQISVALVENHWEQMYETPPDTTELLRDPGPIPEDLLSVPGFITEVMQFTLANAPYPNVALAFCGALALQSYLCGRKVCDEGDLRSNIYLLALASSGTGKDFPRRVNSQILLSMGHIASLGDKFASGEGIQDSLVRTGAMLFQNDEMDGVLRQINLDRENKRESIPNILLTLYTSAADIYAIRAKAGQKEAIHIDQPHLSLFGTATPQYFYESLSTRMLTNGFFARMIIIDVGARGEGQPPGSPRQIPESILQTARWWGDFQSGTARKNLFEVHPDPKVVPYTSEAKQAVANLRQLADAEYDRAHQQNDEVGRVAWSRTCENAKKLALISACSQNHENPVIDLPTVEWATRFAMHQTRRQLYLAHIYVAENPFHADCLKFLRALRVKENGQLTRSELMRILRCKKTDFDQLAETLIAQGEIVPVMIPSKTRPAQGFKLATS